MGDAWSTAPGQKPLRRDYESIVRQAQQSTEHAGDASSEVGLEGMSLKHTDVDTGGGGGSSLGSSHIGSAALTAALTLHPCVFISGVGDASKEVLSALLSTVGNCSVSLVLDEGEPTGEASATFSNAAAAEAAIRRFDGSRFDDGVLSVSVSRRATQGSLTKRGKGRGKGSGGGSRLAFSEAQRDLISGMRIQRQRDEKDAFAQARAALGGRGRGDAELQASAKQAAERSSAVLEEAAAKRRKLQAKLPGLVVVSAKAATAPAAAAAATVGMGMGPPEPSAGAAPATPTAPSAAAVPKVPAAGLLGLASYGSDDDDDDGGEDDDS